MLGFILEATIESKKEESVLTYAWEWNNWGSYWSFEDKNEWHSTMTGTHVQDTTQSTWRQLECCTLISNSKPVWGLQDANGRGQPGNQYFFFCNTVGLFSPPFYTKAFKKQNQFIHLKTPLHLSNQLSAPNSIRWDSLGWGSLSWIMVDGRRRRCSKLTGDNEVWMTNERG